MTSGTVSVQTSTDVQLADYPAGATFGPRRLHDYEFVWLLKGSARWTVVCPATEPGDLSARQTARLLRPGQLALSRAGTIDSYHWDPEVDSSHAYVHFGLRTAALGDERDWPSVRSLTAWPVLAGICSYLLDLATEPTPAARRRIEHLVGVLLDVFVTGPLVENEEALPAQLAPMVALVRDTWRRDGVRIVATEELAEAGAVSTGHLFRLFRQHYGCGPAHALELIRLSRAATALQRSNATISDIAHRTGFANPYHFSRRFAAVYQMPPGAFRKQPDPGDPYEYVRWAGLLPIARALLDG